MKFKDLIWKFDDWNGHTRINDNNLKMICEGSTSDVALRKGSQESSLRQFSCCQWRQRMWHYHCSPWKRAFFVHIGGKKK